MKRVWIAVPIDVISDDEQYESSYQTAMDIADDTMYDIAVEFGIVPEWYLIGVEDVEE